MHDNVVFQWFPDARGTGLIGWGRRDCTVQKPKQHVEKIESENMQVQCSLPLVLSDEQKKRKKRKKKIISKRQIKYLNELRQWLVKESTITGGLQPALCPTVQPGKSNLLYFFFLSPKICATTYWNFQRSPKKKTQKTLYFQLRNFSQPVVLKSNCRCLTSLWSVKPDARLIGRAHVTPW